MWTASWEIELNMTKFRLNKGQVNRVWNLWLRIDEVKDVCQHRTKSKAVVPATLDGKKREMATYVYELSKSKFVTTGPLPYENHYFLVSCHEILVNLYTIRDKKQHWNDHKTISRQQTKKIIHSYFIVYKTVHKPT